jgi:hypothetical protein
MIKRAPKLPTLVRLECILMPNGEIICEGQTLGWLPHLGKYLYEVTDEQLR